MDPQFPQNKRHWPLSRKQTIIITAGIVLLIIIVALIASQSRQDNSDQVSQNVYNDRPGYDRQKLGESIADPFAVTFASNDKAITYKGNKVVQACNLLSTDDITKQDLLIKANTLPTPIARTYNDGVGKGSYEGKLFGSSLTTLGLGIDINSCHYVLESPDGVPAIGINVFQPFIISSSIIDQEIQQDYSSTASIEGLEVYKKKANSSSLPGSNKAEYIIRQQNSGAFYISIGLPNNQTSKEQAILEAAIKNFIREQSTPSGPKTLNYESPVFTKGFTRACDLIANNDIKTLSGKDAGPLLREGIASSIAVLTLNDEAKTSYVNIKNECSRATTGGRTTLGPGGGNFQLTVETTSYLSDGPAKKWIELQHETNPNNRANMELSQQVGDGGVAYTDVAGGQHVIFSKGRIVVDISIDQTFLAMANIRSLPSAADKLTPIAVSMSERVSN